MNQKDKKAAYLLDEIGAIDDCYIAEAMNVRRKPKTGKLILILAACLTLISILIVSVAGAFTFGGIVGGIIRDDINSSHPKPAEELGEMLGVKPFAVKQYKMQAKNFTQKKLKQTVDYLEDAYEDVLKGKYSEQSALKNAVINLL